MVLKFAFVKWLPLGVVTSGLSLLINKIDSSAPVCTYWASIMLITFGLQFFGEYRHSKAMAAKNMTSTHH